MDKPTIFVNPKSGSIKISGEVDRVDVDVGVGALLSATFPSIAVFIVLNSS